MRRNVLHRPTSKTRKRSLRAFKEGDVPEKRGEKRYFEKTYADKGGGGSRNRNHSEKKGSTLPKGALKMHVSRKVRFSMNRMVYRGTKSRGACKQSETKKPSAPLSAKGNTERAKRKGEGVQEYRARSLVRGERDERERTKNGGRARCRSPREKGASMRYRSRS